MIRRPPRSTPIKSSAASDVYKRQAFPRFFGQIAHPVLSPLSAAAPTSNRTFGRLFCVQTAPRSRLWTARSALCAYCGQNRFFTPFLYRIARHMRTPLLLEKVKRISALHFHDFSVFQSRLLFLSSFVALTLSSKCVIVWLQSCLLYTSPSPRDGLLSRMPSSA